MDIDVAVKRFAADNEQAKTNAIFVTLDSPAFKPYLSNSPSPICPRGGEYRLGNTVSDLPTCSVHGNVRTVEKVETGFWWAEDFKKARTPALVSTVCLLGILLPWPNVRSKVQKPMAIALSATFLGCFYLSLFLEVPIFPGVTSSLTASFAGAVFGFLGLTHPVAVARHCALMGTAFNFGNIFAVLLIG